MKAFILCAGFGTRLRPFTYTLPKPLLPVWGRANVCNIIDHLDRSGVKDIIINTHHLPLKLKQVLGESVKYSYEKVLLDTGGGLKKVEHFLKNDTFIMYNCDVVTNVNLNKMIDYHKKNKNLVTLLASKKHLPKAMVVDKKGRVQSFVSDKSGNCAFCGIHIIEPFIFKFIPKNKPISIISVYKRFIEKGIVINTFPVGRDFWQEIGDMESYRNINEK